MRPVCALALVASLALAGCGAPSPRQATAPLAMSTPDVGAPTEAAPTTTPGGTTAVTASDALRRRPPTRVVVLRPVHNGKPANGFVALPRRSRALLSCGGASPSAVNRGIYACGTAADYGVACWKAAPARATMYCLQNPFGKQLAQFPLTHTTLPGAPVPAVPSPLGLVLDDGAHCLIRDGGSWPPLAGSPDWFGTYSCNAANDHILWATGPSDGINRATPTWTVLATGRSSHLVAHTVAVAYVVGS